MPSHRCPEPIGPYEIQLMFGVTRERVAQLRREDDFPEPWKRLATGVIWRDSDIDEYAARKGRAITPLPE